MRFVLSRNGLSPFDADAREFVDRHTDGEQHVVDVEVLFDRDMVEHRHVLACIGRVAKAVRSTPEKVRAELLVATGNFQLLDDLMGMPVIAVNSMSRHAMTDPELHAFWSEAKGVIAEKLLARVSDTAERQRLADSLSLQLADERL